MGTSGFSLFSKMMLLPIIGAIIGFAIGYIFAITQPLSDAVIQNKNQPQLNGVIPDSKQELSSVLYNKFNTDIKDEECSKLYQKIDQKSVKYLTDNLQESDFFLRKRSLIALALIGSNNGKKQISQLIADEDENVLLRSELVKIVDWRGMASNLLQLVDLTKSADIKVAAIEAAQTNKFNTEERQRIDNEFIKVFVDDPDDSVKINILDYFASTDRERLIKIIELLPKDDVSLDVQKHIDFLIDPSNIKDSG